MPHPHWELGLVEEVQWVSNGTSKKYISPPSDEQVFSDTLVCLKKFKHDVRKKFARVNQDNGNLDGTQEDDDGELGMDDPVDVGEMENDGLDQIVHLRVSVRVCIRTLLSLTKKLATRRPKAFSTKSRDAVFNTP